MTAFDVSSTYISRICHIALEIQLAIRLQEYPLPCQSTQWLKRKTTNVLSVVPAWAPTHEGKFSPRTRCGRVAEESRLVIPAAFPTVLVSYCRSSHPPNNEYISTLPTKANNTMHLSAALRAHATSGALRHRASSICTANRLELSECFVSQEGTTDHTSCCKKKKRSRLAPAVQHPARSLIIIVIH